MKIDRNFIALKSGVSSATVSRVFNDPKLVAPDKVELVLAVSKKYGYSPNKMASALRRKNTGIIAFLECGIKDIANISRDFLWTYASGIKSVQSVLKQTMYQINLVSLYEEKAAEYFKKKECDGIVTYNLTKDYKKLVRDSRIPYVDCYREQSKEFNTVFIDEFYGGFLAGECLKNTGHKKPAHIAAGLDIASESRERYEGFKSALGLEPKLYCGDYGIRGGYEQGLKIAKEIKAKQVDGIFAHNDLIAFGVIQALASKGIKIPEDVSLIGYDNMPYLDSLPFKLTTLELPIFETYRIATGKLLQLIKEGGKVYESVKPVLVPGDSVLNRE